MLTVGDEDDDTLSSFQIFIIVSYIFYIKILVINL